MTVIGTKASAQIKGSEPPPQTRNPDIDVLKGVAILMVVFGHVLRGLHEKGIGSEPLFAALDPRLYTVHVQLLFLLSGVLSYGSLVRKGPAFFAKSRFSAVLLPLVLWTYLFMGIKVLAGPFQNQIADLSDFFILPFPGHLHLWFLWALFLIQLCAAAIWGLSQSSSPNMRQGILMFAFVLSLAALFADIGNTGTYWIGSARNNLPFFLLGLVLAATSAIRVPRIKMAWLAVIVFFTIFACVPILRSILGKPMVSLLLCLSAIWAGRRLVLWEKVVPVFVTMGQGTMAIYLLHVIFSAAVRELLIVAGIELTLLHILAGTAAGIVLPLGVAAVLPPRANRALMIA